VKVLLSISRHGRDDPQTLPLAVAEISDPLRTSRTTPTGLAEVVAGDAIVARIIAQCVRHPGLSDVYSQILTHSEGNEVHLRAFPALNKRRLRGLYDAFPTAIPLGTVRAGGKDLRLNPPEDFVVESEDRIVFLATSHEGCEPQKRLPPRRAGGT
jgi:Trk K+ transport system NAD-binding subunit